MAPRALAGGSAQQFMPLPLQPVKALQAMPALGRGEEVARLC